MAKKKEAKTIKVSSAADAIAAIKNKYGKEVITADQYEGPDVRVISSGSLGLDILLNVGGYALSRMVEIYGPEASGKTTLTLHAIANAQREGMKCAFLDVEHALDLDYAADLGVDLSELTYYNPDSGEEALEVLEILTRSEEYALIIVDSVAALVPQKEIEGEMGDSHVGLQARLMNQACRKLSPVAASAGTTIIWLNQLRHKIGVMFGSPETTSGGNALKYYASVRLDIRRIGTIKDSNDQAIGGRTRIKIVKNKLGGTSMNSIEIDMYSNNEHGCGLAADHELFEMAVNLGLLEKAGSWYSYKGEQLGQGKLNAVQAIREMPGVMDSLRRDVISQSNLKEAIKRKMLGEHDKDASD